MLLLCLLFAVLMVNICEDFVKNCIVCVNIVTVEFKTMHLDCFISVSNCKEFFQFVSIQHASNVSVFTMRCTSLRGFVIVCCLSVCL